MKDFPLDYYIINSLRKIWYWHPDRKIAKNNAYSPELDRFKCAKCEAYHEKVHVDHIKPVVDPAGKGPSGYVGWDTYIERSFYSGLANLQVLCKGCHNEKSKLENAKRRARKKV